MAKKAKRHRKNETEFSRSGVRPRTEHIQLEPIVQTTTVLYGTVQVPMTQQVGQRPARVTLMSPDTTEAHRVMNGNAFPQSQRSAKMRMLVDECRDHLSLMCHASLLVREEASRDPKRFLETLKRHGGDIHLLACWAPEVLFENFLYLSGLLAELVAMKAALDQFAKLIKATLQAKIATHDGFHKGKVNGRELAGGKFIAWLRTNASEWAQRDSVTSLLVRNSEAWLDAAVRYRDALVHEGGIAGARGATLILDRAPSNMRLEHVRPPAMPHGESVISYCDSTKTKTLELVRDVSRLLPDVSVQFIG